MPEQVTIEFRNTSGKFTLSGSKALGYTKANKGLVLSPQELHVLIKLHENGVFAQMLKTGGHNTHHERLGVAESSIKKTFKVQKVVEPIVEPEPEPAETDPMDLDGEEREKSLLALTVPKLKQLCKDHGLRIGGTKSELIARLVSIGPLYEQAQ